MYVYIKGLLKYKNREMIIVENSGMGYRLIITTATYDKLPELQDEVFLYTYHYIKEDREELYGFFSLMEKKLFETLISISGIGPSKAVNILSTIEPQKFIRAVINKDIMLLSSLKGIGKKTAERLLIDIGDKMTDFTEVSIDAHIDRNKIEDALSGLLNLGFKTNEAKEILSSITDKVQDTDSAADIIRKALKKHG